MKKRIIALACVIAVGSFIVPTKTFAQLENIATSADSAITVEKVYAGILAGSSYNYEKDTFTRFVSFRVGVAGRWDISKKCTLKAFSAWDIEAVSKASTTFNAFWLQYRPTKTLLLEAGVGPTFTASQHRPSPVSRAGHFEPGTPARLPGVAPTINLRFNPSDRLMFGGGISLRNSMPEYQLSTAIGRFKATVYQQMYNSLTGFTISYADTAGRFGNTFVYYNHTDTTTESTAIPINVTKKVVANFVYYKIKKINLMFYTDFGLLMTPRNRKVVRWESGILRPFKMKYVGGLFGLGYAYEQKSINGYLFVTL